MIPNTGVPSAPGNWANYQKEPQQQMQGIYTAFINGGENTAMSYPVPNGRKIVLIDLNAGLMWIKATDFYGMPMPTRKYKIAEIKAQETNAVTRDEFNVLCQQITQLQQTLQNALTPAPNRKGGAKT